MSSTHNLTKEQKILIDKQVAKYVTAQFNNTALRTDFNGFTNTYSECVVNEAHLLRKALCSALENPPAQEGE